MLALSTSLLALPLLAAASPIVNVRELFRRANATPEVGTDEWTALYPGWSTPTDIPQPWLDALNKAIDAGLIPSADVNPVATITNGWPTYPNGLNALGDGICAGAWGCNTAEDIVQAPSGMIGISQDDGPLPYGVKLYDFFEQENINATHFYIGINVKTNPDVFLQARNLSGQHFAVHTWTHPYMTGKTNEEVVAEFGWTMQILADSNGGKIPAWWRPPYGDVDNRVRAIAKHVFGLTTVIWGGNRDSNDWAIGETTTEPVVSANINKWITGSKTPGLIMLEHELNAGAVQAFIENYPTMKSQGWDCRNIPSLWGLDWYKNAHDDKDEAVVDGSITIYSNTSLASLGPSGSSSSAATSNSTDGSEDVSSVASASASAVSVISSVSASVSAKSVVSSASVSAESAVSSIKSAASASASAKTSGASSLTSFSWVAAFVGSLAVVGTVL